MNEVETRNEIANARKKKGSTHPSTVTAKGRKGNSLPTKGVKTKIPLKRRNGVRVMTAMRIQDKAATTPTAKKEYKFGQGKGKERKRKHRRRLRSRVATTPLVGNVSTLLTNGTTPAIVSTVNTSSGTDNPYGTNQFDIFRDSLEDFSKLFPWEEVDSETFTVLLTGELMGLELTTKTTQNIHALLS